MSEEEKIIENVKQTIEEYEEVIQEEQEKGNVEDVESEIETKQAIQGLLDLYTKQKQTIDKLQKENALYKKIHGNLATEVNRKLYTSNYISKNKIRNKIKEVDTETGIGFELDKDEINGARTILEELLGE